MLKLLNKIISVSLILSLCGCTSTAKQNDIEKYYLARILFSDSDTNNLGFYNSERIGSEDSYLEIDGNKVTYCYYYQRNNEFIKNGSLNEETKEILFEGDSTSYLLTKDDEDIYITYNYRDDIWASLYFSKEKREQCLDELEEINIVGKTDFEKSNIYSTIIEKIDSSLNSIEHEVEFKYEKLYLDFIINSNIANAIKNGKSNDDFNDICETLTAYSTSFSNAIHVGGYKQINCCCRLVCKEENEILFSVEDGEIDYKFVAQPIQNNETNNYFNNYEYEDSDSYVSNSFEDSDVYKEIKESMLNSFREYKPKLQYSESKNTLTCSMQAPKGVHTALDNRAENVVYAWIDYTSNLSALSGSGYDKLCENGYSDIAFIIMVSSDIDSSKCLFATMNGIDYYNILYE